MTTKQRIEKIRQHVLSLQPTDMNTLFQGVHIPKNWGFAPHYDKNWRVVSLKFWDGSNNKHEIVLPDTINIYFLETA